MTRLLFLGALLGGCASSPATLADYWLWLLFRDSGSCQQFLGAVPGYTLTIQDSSHNGIRDIVALTYPYQGHDERYEFDGQQYQKR